MYKPKSQLIPAHIRRYALYKRQTLIRIIAQRNHIQHHRIIIFIYIHKYNQANPKELSFIKFHRAYKGRTFSRCHRSQIRRI